MRVILLCGAVLAGCQCGPAAEVDGGTGGGATGGGFAATGGGSGGGAATGGGGVGGSGGGIDAGPPNRVQIYGGGSFPARSCQQITVRSVGLTTTPVFADTLVSLDGGPWVEFFDGTNCSGTPTNAVTLQAGMSMYEFRFRANAYGALSAEASAAMLDSGIMTFTSEVEVLFDGDRTVLPAAACFPTHDVKAVVPFSTTEVPAAVPSRFTLITSLPFGGSSTDAGCTNSQFEVTMAAGSARAPVYAFSSGSAGATATLTLSPVLPPGVRFPTNLSRVNLYAQCLPTGVSCDGGAACCGGACATGACP
ncbi:MAG: hypothetical protein JNM17_26895 [Archangium sp.]|nr:hypothetical protein [Archangium sp.]